MRHNVRCVNALGVAFRIWTGCGAGGKYKGRAVGLLCPCFLPPARTHARRAFSFQAVPYSIRATAPCATAHKDFIM